MEGLKLVKCLIFILSLEKVVGWNNEVLKIVDVVRSHDRPTAVVAKVCWGIADRMKLAVECMKTDNAKTIQFIENNTTLENFNEDNIFIIVDLNCQDIKRFLEHANINKKFKIPYRWIILSTGEDNLNYQSEIPSELHNLSILLDSDVIIAKKNYGNETVFQRAYRIDSTTDFITEEFAMWTVETGFTLLTERKDTDLMKRKNLKGKRISISVVTVNNSTTSVMYNLNDLVTDNVAKCSFHNILPLYDFINATIDVIFTDTWGYYINNSWNGMIGQIKRGDADLCGTIILMRLKRMDVLSFMTQPVPITTKFLLRQPPLSLQNNLFYLPFRTTVWMCTGALILVLVFVIYVTAKWEVENNGTKSNDPTVLRPNVSDVAIFVAGAVVQQSGNSGLKGSLGRAVIFMMFLIFLFLYTSYSANIVALLQSSSNQIRTLSDLLNSKLELGVEDQPYTRYYFMTATDQLRKAIYENKVARTGYKPNFMAMEEGVKRLQNMDTPFAFHMNLGFGYKVVQQIFYEHEKCGLQEIEYIPNGVPWLCCKKQSPYQEVYKVGLARILEHGLSDRVNRLIYARKPTCTSRCGSFGSVSMMDFHPVLMCLLYGMIASVMLLMLEILIHKRKENTKLNTERSPSSVSDGI